MPNQNKNPSKSAMNWKNNVDLSLTAVLGGGGGSYTLPVQSWHSALALGTCFSLAAFTPGFLVSVQSGVQSNY